MNLPVHNLCASLHHAIVSCICTYPSCCQHWPSNGIMLNPYSATTDSAFSVFEPKPVSRPSPKREGKRPVSLSTDSRSRDEFQRRRAARAQGTHASSSASSGTLSQPTDPPAPIRPACAQQIAEPVRVQGDQIQNKPKASNTNQKAF